MSRLAFADLLLRDAAALVIVKATVVLALASAAAAAAKGFSAARRHTLWLVALSSCVWLVLSSPVVPAIRIHAPMLAERVVTVAVRPTAAAPTSAGNTTVANASRVWERFPSTETVWRSSTRSIPLPSHPLIALWIIGCVALLVRHAVGFVGATRLARRASFANDDETMPELAGATAAAGVKRDVRLGYSTEVRTPITFGVATPYVLLPTEARSWSIERRRAVLVHETAHIARGDWLSQAIGKLACELFWFHPLVWRAFARLRDEAERATDDCVLRSGMPACEYATHLLELARRTTNARPERFAIGIVSTNDLERRLVAMFDTKRSRATVTSRARAVTTSFALAIVCPLASLRVAAPASPTNALRAHAALESVSLPPMSIRQPASAGRATADDVDTARVAPNPEVRATIVPQAVSKAPLSSIALVDNSTPSPNVHPDFSGKWRMDTVAVPTQVWDYFVTDSSIIKQSENSISFDSRGHFLAQVGYAGQLTEAPTHNFLPSITFDGATSSGVAVSGITSRATNLIASAVWVRDTLVLTTRSQDARHDFLTIERMTLSADGAVLSDSNLSLVDGNVRWGGPHTFVLRRITP